MKKKENLIGMKSSLAIEEIENKLFAGLGLVELYLIDRDFDAQNYIQSRIDYILEKYPQIKIMLHCPVILNKKTNLKYSLALIDEDYYFYIKKMYQICVSNSNVIGFVMHPENGLAKSNEEIFEKNLLRLRSDFKYIDNYMYIENLTKEFTKFKNNFLSFLKKFKIKCVCFDFAHFSAYNGEEEFYETLEFLNKNYKLYCHISDNNFLSKNPLPKNLNSGGEIDFKIVASHFNLGILETFSKDEKLGVEMKSDYFILKEIIDNSNKV